MISDFILGLGHVPRGIRLILSPGMRRYAFVPLLINLMVSLGAFLLLLTHLNTWLDSLLPHQLLWLSWLIAPILFITLSLLVFYVFVMLATLIALPFNVLLAEKLERQLDKTHASQPVDLSYLLKSTSVGVTTQLSFLIYQFTRLVPLLLLFAIPFVNLLASSLLIVFSIWMLALGYLSIPMGNHNLGFKAIKHICHRRWSMVMGLGCGLLLFTWIPLLNILVLPTGTAAATVMWSEQLNKYASEQDR